MYLFLLVFLHVTSGYCACFFNEDMQGHYLTQSTVTRGSDIDYLEVVVEQNSIPVWGNCHRRFGNNVILLDMAGSVECMRCFHIVSRSNQVLEVHTEGLERCYTNEGAALTKCPTPETIQRRNLVEIMLYKTHELGRTRLPPPVYCPIEGKYRLTYDINDGTEGNPECPEPLSEFSNCPEGNRFVIGFRKCTFEDFEKSFQCLGSWSGRNGHKFLALHDSAVDRNAFKGRRASQLSAPKYRCAMYRYDGEGKILMSFSSDSTCFNNLHSPDRGFETLILLRQGSPLLPHIVNRSTCIFPLWSQGQWESLWVEDNSMSFTDIQKQNKYTVHCVGGLPQSSGIFPVYTRSHCGRETFSCLAIEERSPNVIEFRITLKSEPFYYDGMCLMPSRLVWPRWITQGRVDRFRSSPCPVAGEYIGTIPDEPTWCTKLYSDCNNLEVMFYTVYSCANKSLIYEEREYRCLGQWTEHGITYTYTERRDMIRYECFAGVVVIPDQVFIEEAGASCRRGLKPLMNGMKLLKQASCSRRNRPTNATKVSVWRKGSSPGSYDISDQKSDQFDPGRGSSSMIAHQSPMLPYIAAAFALKLVRLILYEDCYCFLG